MSFSRLGLSPALLHAVREHAFAEPSAIQEAAVPAILAGRDLLASAQTGSGKTAAFCLPLLQALQGIPRSSPRRVHSLILVPTRELAVQVGDTLRALAAHLPWPVKLAVAFGGVSINPQMLHLRGGADIVIATPGRLLDLIGHNALQLDQVHSLVLDEADRLLDAGFADELTRILDLLPARRQNLFFSATISAAVEDLARAMLRDPVRIDIEGAGIAAADSGEPAATPDITERAITVDAKQRTQLLRHLIETQRWSRVLVFVATQYAAERVASKLRRARINAEPFHGELSQSKRSQVLSDFKASRLKVVIATDVAARGLDISSLPVVVNYDLPRSSDDYLHRIGRTGRAGASGIAVSFVCSDSANEAHFRLIERRHGRRIPREQIAGFEPAASPQAAASAPAPVGDDNGGIKGKRPSRKDKLRALASSSIPDKP